ncbi:MAG TPA: transglutaminase-like cysteine peptidase [Alphaproteobacteria bacterium]|nr:transglutaminase-like cysteine peptidase [Alphaproteobacteria bacterium]
MLRRSLFFTGLYCALLNLAPIGISDANAAADDVLKAENKQSAPLSILPQWKRILEDYAFEGSIEPSQKYRAWKKFIASIENDPPIRQLLKVNLWFNGFPYKQDNWIYGEEDHWATPSEFLENGGDCEDYVIIKYLTLRRLGFPAKDMKIAMVYDVFSGTDHALLVVDLDGENYILDNRDNMTVAAHYTKRYKPHFVFNEENLWTYDSPVIARAKAQDNDAADIMPGNR